MPSISEAEFGRLLETFGRESLHLEMRDAYGTETELPYMAAWSRGEPDDLAWLAGWCDTLRAHTARGATVRRARIVSEPLSATSDGRTASPIRWSTRARTSAGCHAGSCPRSACRATISTCSTAGW